jgi:hypothetical protein
VAAGSSAPNGENDPVREKLDLTMTNVMAEKLEAALRASTPRLS